MDVFSGDGTFDDGARELPETQSEAEYPQAGAPRYRIPHRELGAVEIPARVEDADRAVRAFGRVPSLHHALEPDRHSIPLYLKPESPFCKPLMSHNARSHNVVLKVKVPKRTGRKRKRGSGDPWEGDVEVPDSGSMQAEQVSSHSRLDDPELLRRKLSDNVGKYEVEVVGMTKHTHRFRGLDDFYWDTSRKSDFSRRYVDQVLSGDVQKIKNFQFEPGIDRGPDIDIIPPPVFTHMGLPFNYFYSQNPYVRTAEDGETFNVTAVKHIGHFIGADDPAPQGPQHPPDMMDPRVVEVMAELEAAFEERPVWTRRSLMNYLGGKLRNWNELKKYLNYAAYQFKGGPWRDGVVPYGLDPRTDPKYRIYQTVMFKLLPGNSQTTQGPAWHSIHGNLEDQDNEFHPDLSQSHIFDGETYQLDGKVWQVCDITDPMLRGLLENAAVRPERDANSGWYHGGLWAKVKAIMKTKLVAIRFGRHLTREDFAVTLMAGDETPVRAGTTTSVLPLPNLGLTNEETRVLRGRVPSKLRKNKHPGYSVRVRNLSRSESQTAEPSSTVGDGELLDIVQDESDNEDGDSGSGSENESGENELGEGRYEYPEVPV